MRSLWIAVAMYSKLPVPQVEWDRKSLSWALCFFPVVGVVIGLLLGLWLELCALLDIGPWLRAAGALLLPVAVSGAIHLDGFCDTADALGSHQPREKKLEILKDSHTGAFAIICCCLYLITFFAVWCEAEPAGGAFWVLCLGPALSRSLSGLAACSWPTPWERSAGNLYAAHGRQAGAGGVGAVGNRLLRRNAVAGPVGRSIHGGWGAAVLSLL